MILTRSSSRNCKMTFIIGRGFAERQILTKWKWLYLLNWVEYFDKLLRKHTKWNIVMKFCIHIDIDKMYPMRLSNDIWGWLSFGRGSNSEKSKTISKWHLLSVEALPSAKFWKSVNGLISRTKWNKLIDFCVNIDIIKIYSVALEIVKCHFSSV